MNLFRFILVALTISSTSWAQIVSQPKATISLPPAQVQIVSPHGPSKKSFQPMTTPPEQQAPFSKEVRNNNSFLSQGIDTNALKEIPLKKKNVEFSMGTSSSGGGDARNIEAQSFTDAN